MMNLDVKHSEPNNDKSEINYVNLPEEDLKTQDIVEDEFTEEWLKNGNFTSVVDPWFNTTEGDTSDVSASYSDNEAHYDVTGDAGKFELYEVPPTDSDWTRTINPNFPYYPDTAIINSDGCYVSHYWAEGADQSVSAHWEYNATTTVNMSDYEINSASLVAICNATVSTYSADPPDYSGGLEAGNDYPSRTTQYATGDYIRFYVLIADRNKNNVFEVAYNQTSNLGQDSPVIAEMDDTIMVTIPEETLKFYLTSVLSADYYNFTVILGIRLWCEDNFPQDSDRFDDVLIKSINLTFTYEKKIDKLTSLSWDQIGDELTGSNVDVKEARLNFKYRINETWPIALSPNSEIQIIINDTKHPESIDLSDATTSFKDAKTGGFDVTNLIKKNVNISLSLKVYLADNFIFDRTIRISIDNVSLEITYTVSTIEETTELKLFFDGIDKTLDKTIDVPWREEVNISVMYVNQSSGAFIDNAYVTINGSGVSKVMPDNGFNNYTTLINSTELNIYGYNYLTIEASRRYYEIQTITIRINVIDRPTYLDIAFNGTSSTDFDYYNISTGQILNITAWYKEADDTTLVNSATVELIETGLGINPMPRHPLYDQYNISINTTDLGLGVKFLSITAEKNNYTSRSETVTVIITERATEMRIMLNGTDKTQDPSIELNVNETLNITTTYRDFVSSNHLGGARVRIFGSGINDNLTDYGLEQYTYFLNTSDLAQGANIINVFAEKDGYESKLILLTIIISQRNTSIEIFLNGTDFSHVSPVVYTLTIGELVNITIKYKDWLTGTHIDLASVDLEGEGLNKPLPENNTLGHYSIILDSEDLNRGINFLTITAYKPNYQPRQKQIKIEIKDKASILSLYINGDNRTSETFFNFVWGDPLNITVFYQENNSKQLIDDATIEIREGGTLLFNLTRSAKYYNRTINTADLGVGIRSLLIIATKENYETITKNIIITVSERDTYLNILINNINASTVNSFNFTLGESLNITVWYRDDATGDFIFTANLELIGLGAPLSLIKHSQYDQYNLSILANDLSLGANYLQITAQKDNYTNLFEPIMISISEKIAELQLFINGTQISYNGNKTVEVDQILNITATFRDYGTPTHITNANIELLGIRTFDEDPGEYYNLTLDIEDDLQQEGLATLIIIAEKTNYKTQTFQFFLKIVQKQTFLEIFFDNDNVTIDPTITLPIGSILNLTVKYTDIAGAHITSANVTLGLDFSANLTQQLIYQQYYIIIDTSLLKIGINIISLEAKKPNHEIQAENLRIQIRKIRTEIDTEDGEDTITIRPGEDVKITIELKDLDFGGGIEDAEVTYDWKLGDGDLDEEGDGLYEFTLEDVPEGTYTITISVYKEGSRYEFDDFEITLVVKRPAEENLLFLILLIIAIIVGVSLAAYLIAYQKYLKYPKPVRKVRKYRRTLKKKGAPSVDIKSREKAFNELYSEEVGKTSKLIKSKQKEEIISLDKLIKNKSLKSPKDKPVEELPKKTPQKSLDDTKK